MSTNCTISVMHGDKIKTVYVHYDGYLSGVGKTLLNHYNSAKANELVSLGDLSSVGKEIGEKHDFDNCDDNTTTAYGRDGEESDTGYEVFYSLSDMVNFYHNYIRYHYVMKEGVWYVYFPVDGNYVLRPLTEELIATE